MMKPREQHITYNHGDAVDILWRKEDHRFVCCGCGFTHRLRFTVVKDKLRMRVWDDKRWEEEQDNETDLEAQMGLGPVRYFR